MVPVRSRQGHGVLVFGYSFEGIGIVGLGYWGHREVLQGNCKGFPVELKRLRFENLGFGILSLKLRAEKLRSSVL